MPTYEYACADCEKQFEAFQKITEDALTKCQLCGGSNVQRLVSASAFHLKGSGWYKTDYGSKGSAASTATKSTDSDSSAGSDKSASSSADSSSSESSSSDGASKKSESTAKESSSKTSASSSD